MTMSIPTKIYCLFLILFSLALNPASAKEATPMAADPELEKKVMEISEELRCLVCQNQTIADSDAGLARDLKKQVRKMLSEGKTQEEILDFMVQRYGDFVRYRPPVKPTTYALWAGPAVLMVLGVAILLINLKNRRKLVTDTPPLSEDDNKTIDELLKEQSTGDSNADKESKS